MGWRLHCRAPALEDLLGQEDRGGGRGGTGGLLLQHWLLGDLRMGSDTQGLGCHFLGSRLLGRLLPRNRRLRLPTPEGPGDLISRRSSKLARFGGRLLAL